MRIRVILPVVFEDEDARISRMIDKSPDRFTTVDAIFYNIDAIEAHDKFSNFSFVHSSGKTFEVALSPNEVDRIVMGDVLGDTNLN